MPQSSKSIVFLDTAVENYQLLAKGVKSQTQVVIVDPTHNGIEQITQKLAEHRDVDSVHIVSHGQQGGLQIGSTQLNSKSLQTYASEFEQWGDAVNNKDILLYGCNIAQGKEGQNFVSLLSQLTGANVAASNDLTGSADLGGDWVLEYATGLVKSTLAFSEETLQMYTGVLITINGSPNNDTLVGTVENDTISGNAGNDVIDGRDGNDSLIGGTGNDRFIGSKGNDSLNGGDGSDTADYSQLGQNITLLPVGLITKGGGLGQDTLLKVEKIIADARATNNTIDASTASGASINANLQAQTLAINGIAGIGPFAVVNFDDVKGTNQNDTIIGDSQSNQLFGNDGNDNITGNEGVDLINGGNGDDVLTGDSNNVVVVGPAQDFIFGGEGNDVILGGEDNDLLNGQGGADSVSGGSGNDILTGSSGNDSLNGGDGSDTADYSQLGQNISVSVATGIVTKGGSFGQDALSSIETVVADATAANNTIDASTVIGASINTDLQGQTLTISSANNVALFTVVNFDDVKGTNQNDAIIGDSQNNQLFGNGGNDILTGGAGNDLLSGGLNADSFVFRSLSEGIDTINDFLHTDGDKIQIKGSTFGAISTIQFSYNSSTGALSFNNGINTVQFASLNINSGFNSSVDIIIV